MKCHIIVFILMLMVVILSSSSTALAAEADDIQLPASVEVENKNDLTLFMLYEMLGEPFKEIAGEPSYRPRATGVITGNVVMASMPKALLGILGMLNLVAMFYIGAGVIYLWVIFAATTAHEGERIGGGVYDSLWVPIRQAGAFVLAVPVFNGLSVMQVLILACVGMSINFANSIWDTTSSYMVKYANVGIIETAAAPIDQDIYRLLPLMFKDSVIQQVDLSLLEDGNTAFPTKKAEGEVLFHGLDWNGNPNHDQSINGPKISLLLDTEKGEAVMRIRTTPNMDPTSIGAVILDYPAMGKNGAEEGSDAEGGMKLKSEIANIRIKYLAQLWGEVYKAAEIYLQSQASSPTGASGCALPMKGGEACLPGDDAKKAIVRLVNVTTPQIIAQMARDVDAAVKRRVATLDKDRLQSMMEDSLEIGTDGKSAKGWVAAGLFPLSMGLLQKQYNFALEGSVSSTPGDFQMEVNKLQKVLKNSNIESGLRRAEGYFNAQAILSKNYSSSFLQTSFNGDGGVDKGLGAIQRAVTKFFAADSHKRAAEYSGMLGIILTQLGTYDPVVVMQNFGNKLFSSATDWKTLTAAAAADLTLGGGFAIMSVILLIAVACFFSYIVPMIPLIFWMIAVISWLFMVMEAMVAAPFWVAMHISPEGKGVMGDHARRGYMLLLELVARPALLVVGAVFAVAMCQLSGWFVNRLLAHWFGSIANDFLSIGFFGDLVYTILVLSLIYYIYYTIFTKGVMYMPEKVLAWCGAGSGMGLSGADQTMKKTLVAGGVLSVGVTGGAIGSAASKGIGAGRKKLVDLRAKRKAKKEQEKQNSELAEKVKSIVQAQIAERTGDAPKADDKPKADAKPKSKADERLEKWVGGLVNQEMKGKKPEAGKAVENGKATGDIAEKKVEESGKEKVATRMASAVPGDDKLVYLDTLTGERTYASGRKAMPERTVESGEAIGNRTEAQAGFGQEPMQTLGGNAAGKQAAPIDGQPPLQSMPWTQTMTGLDGGAEGAVITDQIEGVAVGATEGLQSLPKTPEAPKKLNFRMAQEPEKK